jgi:hypothetical protein
MVGLQLQIPEPQDNEELATDKQKALIKNLCQEVGASGFPADTLEDLGKLQASSVIDQLQSFKKALAGDKPLDDEVSADESSFPNVLWLLLGAIVVIVVVVLTR